MTFGSPFFSDCFDSQSFFSGFQQNSQSRYFIGCEVGLQLSFERLFFKAIRIKNGYRLKGSAAIGL